MIQKYCPKLISINTTGYKNKFITSDFRVLQIVLFKVQKQSSFSIHIPNSKNENENGTRGYKSNRNYTSVADQPLTIYYVYCL
jgi:hypothetical protein